MIEIMNNRRGVPYQEETDLTTVEGCDACLRRLQMFRIRKRNTEFDSFTHSDLDFFEKCVIEQRNKIMGL